MHANTLRYIGKLQLVLLPGVIKPPFEKSAYSIHIPSKSVCKRKSWTICNILRIFNNRVGISFIFFMLLLCFVSFFLYLLLFILLFYFLSFCFVLVFCSLLCLSTSVVINKNTRTLIWSISFTNTVHNMPKFW